MIKNNLVSVNSFITKGFLFSVFFSFLLFSSVSLFSQTAEDEKNFQQCKACHSIGGGKLIGPDLKGVTEKYSEEWLIKFIQNSQELIAAGDEQAVKVFNEYNKIPMPPHALTDDQVRGLLVYIDAGGVLPGSELTTTEATSDSEGVQHSESVEQLAAEIKQENQRNMGTIFWVMIILFVVSLFDLVIIHIVKAKWIHYIIMITAVAIIAEIVFVEATGLGRQQYYQPDQPIQFSHEVHAGQNQIDCKYCHFTTDRSMHAGIPPVELCMNCHNQVKEGKKTGKEEIAKIYAAIENNDPIEWVKVYNLPDHVYFNHAQHVNVGKLDCAQCHGEVEKMDQIIQVPDLSMGWCIDCHRNESVQFASNKFYEQYKKLHQKIEAGEMPNVTVQDIGGDECAKCHY
jgi:cytochrome c551/c552